MFGLAIPPQIVKIIAYALTALALVLAGRTWGILTTYREWIRANTEAAVASAKIIDQQIVVTEKIVIEYRDRIKVIEGTTTTIQNEVTRYVESKPLALACMLDNRWVYLHNSAAAGTIPTAASGPDATASTLTLADALQPITENYSTYHQVSARLTALQKWIREQFLAVNGKTLEP